jgi:hypothetical protein
VAASTTHSAPALSLHLLSSALDSWLSPSIEKMGTRTLFLLLISLLLYLGSVIEYAVNCALFANFQQYRLSIPAFPEEFVEFCSCLLTVLKCPKIPQLRCRAALHKHYLPTMRVQIKFRGQLAFDQKERVAEEGYILPNS